MTEAEKRADWIEASSNIVDLLRTEPSLVPFRQRVLNLGLTDDLEKKIFYRIDAASTSFHQDKRDLLTRQDEKELGTEVLLNRHRFTALVCRVRPFRQAALSVVQNNYLFRNRKLFFGTDFQSEEQERQEAIQLLGCSEIMLQEPPLSKTFQHPVIARIWNRILQQSTESSRSSDVFMELHQIVEQLNVLRNIYILLCRGIVHRLARTMNRVYRQSLTYEDAVQVGSFGIARAAYRYHFSSGVRFSTYASHWVKKEIQRQALEGRLMRISAGTVERFARAAKENDAETLAKVSSVLQETELRCLEPAWLPDVPADLKHRLSPEGVTEGRQLKMLLLEGIETVLSEKSGDLIRRRYGLSPYCREQSVIEISEVYRVTRSSVYQRERTALKKLFLFLKDHCQESEYV